jgi:hypothetical protein
LFFPFVGHCDNMSAGMKADLQKQARRESSEEAFRCALHAVPGFNGVETLMPVALELRRVWARFHPHMEAVFNLTGHYPI